MADTGERAHLIEDLEQMLRHQLSIDAFRSKYASGRLAVLEVLWPGLHHWFADEDIRERDADYRAMQEGEMAKLIQLLRDGASEDRLGRIHFLGRTKD